MPFVGSKIRGPEQACQRSRETRDGERHGEEEFSFELGALTAEDEREEEDDDDDKERVAPCDFGSSSSTVLRSINPNIFIKQ